MNLCIFVTSILYVATNGQQLNRLHFTKEVKTLMACIEDSKTLKDVKRLRGSDFVHIFAEFAAKKLSGRTNVDQTSDLNNVIESCKNEHHDFPSTSSGEFWNDRLVDALRNALIHCSDDSSFKLCSDKNHVVDRKFIPNFESERDEKAIARRLNLEVCVWSIPLRTIATTPDGFITLMNYADHYMSATQCAHEFSFLNSNRLRVEVRRLYSNRIQNDNCSLFVYHYNPKDGIVYTCSCNKRMDSSYLERVSREEVSSTLRLFQSQPVSGRRDDVHNRYTSEDMMIYERDFELLSFQNRRIVLFIYYLRVLGILTPKSKINPDFISTIPEYVLEILSDDDACIALLASIREFIYRHGRLDPLEDDIFLYLDSEVNLPGRRFDKFILQSYSIGSLLLPRGLYLEDISKNPSRFTNTTTTTTVKPMSTSDKPWYKSVKDTLSEFFRSSCYGRDFNNNDFLSGCFYGCGDWEGTFDSCLKKNFLWVNDGSAFNSPSTESENYGKCYTNDGSYLSNFKGGSDFVLEALNFYVTSKHCVQSAF